MAKKEFLDFISDFASGYYKDKISGEGIGKGESIIDFPKKEDGMNYVNSSAGEKAETSIEELRNRYSERARAQYEQREKKLRAERDEALRENWILQQQAEAALPEQMAAAGLNGGAAETTLAALRAKYQGNRNDIRGDYMDNLGGITEELAAQQAENERAYNEKWIDYLLSLAKMEEEYDHKKALAAIGG